MIRVWLSRESSIPIREQLGAQLILGIFSRRLGPGDRLPSVRELARRLNVHANTISSVYSDLASRGWVSRRAGSGVYVRDLKVPEAGGGVEAFVRACVEDGFTRGFTIEAIEKALEKIRHELRQAGVRRFLVVHPDRDLADILSAEIEAAAGPLVSAASIEEVAAPLTSETCILATSACESQVVGMLAPQTYRVIRLKPMEDVISGQTRSTGPQLVGVVSRSNSVHQWSQTLLAALGIPIAAVLNRNPAAPGWKDGLGACDIVAVDVKAALELPKKIRPTVFRIVSDDFLDEIRQLLTVKPTLAS